MAEAVTALEIGLAITSIISGLFTYTKSVKNAKDDIRTLTQELLALKAALEHFDLHSRSDLPPSLRDQAVDVLELTSETLAGINARLDRAHTGKLRGAVEAVKWPFQSAEVKKHIETIERAKSWFIMVILRDSSDATGQVVKELRSLVQLVEEDIMQRRESTLVKRTGELLRWLAPFDSRAHLEKAAKAKTPGTGQWVLQDQKIHMWMNPQQPTELRKPFMWISGKSGSGKTVLFSTIVEHIQALCNADSPPKRLFGYHCCSLDEVASQQLPNIFGSILAYVGVSQPALLEGISQRRNASPRLVPQNDLSMEEIRSVFSTIARSTKCFYVLVDAVNEAPAVRDLLTDTLQSFCREYDNVRVLVTCTGEPPRASEIMQYQPMVSLRVDSDIHLYIQERLRTERGFANLSQTIRQYILERITADADGMFRWAKLCLDRLSVLRTGRDIRDALTDMPRTLNDTYTTILARIPAHDKALARDTLLWLCFCVRPLQLSELAEAVILRVNDFVIEDDARLTNNSVLLDICNGLVVRSGIVVTLAHDSVRSFLTSEHIQRTSASYFALDAHKAHAHIMSRCLTYLRLSIFSLGPVKTMSLLQERKEKHPLLSYATTSWPIHSESFPMQPSDERKILDFFATKSEGYTGSSFDSWVQFLLEQTDLNTIRQTQPIYYAASFNMVAILRILTRPELGIDIERRGGRFLSTPLYIAVWRGNWEAAEILLRAGADPRSRDVLTETCYTWAARKGPASLVALMDEILEARKAETYIQVERPLEYRLRSDADPRGKRKNPFENDNSSSSRDAGSRENDTWDDSDMSVLDTSHNGQE